MFMAAFRSGAKSEVKEILIYLLNSVRRFAKCSPAPEMARGKHIVLSVAGNPDMRASKGRPRYLDR
jgi:hypothetical protein